jgi:hypothetical protein
LFLADILLYYWGSVSFPNNRIFVTVSRLPVPSSSVLALTWLAMACLLMPVTSCYTLAKWPTWEISLSPIYNPMTTERTMRVMVKITSYHYIIWFRKT